MDRRFEIGGWIGWSGSGLVGEGRWRGSGAFLGTNKEVFDAEDFAILQAVKLINARGECGGSYTIFSDS